MSGPWTKPVTVEEIYGDWDDDAAAAAINRSLSPRPPDSIFDIVGSLGVGPGDVVLDIGGREGQSALAMAERFGCRAVSVDPIRENNERGAELVAAHDCGALVEMRQGSIEQIPAADGSYQLILARDMLFHIEDLALALTECRRVLVPDGFMVIFGSFKTPMLHPEEERSLSAHVSMVPERLSVENFESTVADTGFSIERREILGSEHVEATQENGTGSNHLLQLSRLRRAQESLVEELGEVPYRVMYGNALWTIYQVIGKLEACIYALRRDEE